MIHLQLRRSPNPTAFCRSVRRCTSIDVVSLTGKRIRQYGTCKIASLRVFQMYAHADNIEGNTYHDIRRLYESMIGGLLASVCAALTINNGNNTSKCYLDTATSSDLPNYGSSSDPMFESQYTTLEEEELILQPIHPPTDNADELNDPNSTLSKSVRAFATSAKAYDTVVFDSGKDETGIAIDSTTPNHTILSRLQSLERQDDNSNVVTTQKMYFYHSPELETYFADKLVLLAGPSSELLGCDVGHLLGVPVNRMDVGKYEDGETRVQVLDSVRGKKVFIVQSTTSADAVMELLLLVSAVSRASAKQVTAVIPYYGYSRQDARKTTREPIAAADLATMLEEMGVDRVICMDLHNDNLRGFFKPQTPVEHLVPVPVAAAYFHEEIIAKYYSDVSTSSSTSLSYPPVTVVASHEGNVDRASLFRSALQKLSGQEIELAVLAKSKTPETTRSNIPHLVGNVHGRVCIIVDDIVSTGTTLVSSIQKLQQQGATSIYAWATHGVFATMDATQILQAEESLEFLLISNSVHSRWKLPSKIRSLNVAPLLAEAIARSLYNQSISGILSMDQLEQQEHTVSRYDAS